MKKILKWFFIILLALIGLGYISQYEFKSDAEINKEISELEQKAKKIPASNFVDNYNIYKKLIALDANNKKYKEKHDYYQKKGGFLCYSSLNQRVFNLVKHVKNSMRDAESFELVESTVYTTEKDGTRFVDMTYKGKNGFGGTSVEKVRGKFKNETCEILSVQKF
jgi:hypothetical protein